MVKRRVVKKKKFSFKDFYSGFKNKIYIYKNIFNYLLIGYLVLLLIQEFDYLLYLNSNILLIPLIVFGIVTAIYSKDEEEKKEEMKTFDKILVWVLGLIGMVLIFVKTKELGWLSYVISLISGVLIVLVGYLIYEDDDNEEFNFEFNKKTGLYVLISLVILSVVLFFFIGLSSFRIVFGSVYVLFIPGFIISYLFFSKKEIDSLERIALSFALSISVIPLLVFYLNLIGMRINALNVSLLILFVCLIGLYFIKINFVDKCKKFFDKRFKK
ncbi:MAG: DUF1616 domain-containing protein [Candidatus Woesearchaeota archaeon]